MALVQTGHFSGPDLLVQGYSEEFSVKVVLTELELMKLSVLQAAQLSVQSPPGTVLLNPWSCVLVPSWC